MPIYEYVCHTCGQTFEEMQKFSDAALTECTCGKQGSVERKVSRSAFHLKGGGWYKDGYGSSSSSSSDSGSKSSAPAPKNDTSTSGSTDKGSSSSPAEKSSSSSPATSAA